MGTVLVSKEERASEIINSPENSGAACSTMPDIGNSALVENASLCSSEIVPE